MRWIAAIAGMLCCGPAFGQAPIYQTPHYNSVIIETPLQGPGATVSRPSDPVRAMDYGACTWDATHDVGACINAAIAVAVARTGATVVIPAGVYGMSTPIVQTTSGVHLQGAGTGQARDNMVSASFRAITRLVWIGAAGATMLSVGPASTAVPSLNSADIVGIVWDCASLANICVQINQTSNSQFDFGVSEPRSIGAYLTTSLTTDSPGTQNNDIAIAARSTNAAYSPTGILIDGGQGSNWNVSANRFSRLYAWYYKGDGIVFGNSDNNIITDLATFPQPGATGSAVIFAGGGYTSPNGVSTSTTSPGYATRVLHTTTPVTVHGLTNATQIVAGANAGTAAVTPVSLTTNATTAIGQIVLNFAATTGVAADMDAKCTDPSSGILNSIPVVDVTATTVSLGYPAVRLVPSGQACTFGFGVTTNAVVGVYTLAATNATTYTLTAPAGGHTEAGVTLTSGYLGFTDMILPISGTAVAGDSWTITVRAAPNTILLESVDKANAQPNPHFNPGASGSFTTTTNPFQVQASALGGINIPFAAEGCSGRVPTTGNQSINIGNCGGTGASGGLAAVIGGVGNTANGFGSATFGGHNLVSSGKYSAAMGEAGITTGYTSRVAGNNPGDRARYATDCFASGAFAVNADAQSCVGVLRGTGATGSAFRLTADGLAAGAINCINIPNNAAYALIVTINALNHTAVANNEAWLQWGGLLTRGANAAATAVRMATTPTPLTNGTVAGSAIAATADTSNGCLNVSFTPPTANTDTWDVVARVETVEVQ